jgi:hypothetical protein
MVMKYNKYNKKYGGKDPHLDRIVIANDEEPTAIDESGKRKSRLVTPRSKNAETLVAHPPSPHESDVRIKHQPELKSGFLELSKKGTIRFTSYEEHNPG